MKENETWNDFMIRAKQNGLSPVRQEEEDREHNESVCTLPMGENSITMQVDRVKRILNNTLVDNKNFRPGMKLLHPDGVTRDITLDDIKDWISWINQELDIIISLVE